MVVLKTNTVDNPYSEIIHNFLSRQLFISANASLVEKSLDITSSFSGHSLVLGKDDKGQLIFFSRAFRLDKDNKKTKVAFLQQYLTLSLLVQSFEAFEAFLRDVYRKHIELNVKGKSLQSYVSNGIPRSNLELIKHLKQFYPSLGKYYKDKFLDFFESVQEVRHAVIHSDQIMNAKSLKKLSGKKLFKEFFDLKNEGSERYRVQLKDKTSSELTELFTSTGFQMFQLVSHDENYPVAFEAKQGRRWDD